MGLSCENLGASGPHSPEGGLPGGSERESIRSFVPTPPASMSPSSPFVRWLRDNPALERERVMREGQARRRGGWGELLAWAGVPAALALTAGGAWWLSRPERNPWEARTGLLLAIALYYLLAAGAVTGPAAAAITGERERETWQELLLTRLAPGQVAWAKLLTALRGGASVLAAFLPVLALGFHAGRIPLDHALPLLLVLTAPVAAAAALALWISSRFRRTRFSISVAYLLVLGLFGATIAWAPGLLARGENVWWYASPVWQAAVLVLAEPQASPLAVPLLPEWTWGAGFYLTLGALSLWRVARRIGQEEPA